MKALVLCAGEGTRFQPLSLACPKPLTPVEGLPLLEHSLRRLKAQGIEDITLVVGYMRERFDYLVERYDVRLLYNPRFHETNNNTSVALAAHLLDDCLILDGDLFFSNSDFLNIAPGPSRFISQQITHSPEWRLELDEQQRINGVEKWCRHGWGMVGVSYWQGEGARLLAEELQNSAPGDYWEDSALRVFAKTPVYAVCHETPFVREMDTVKEALDTRLLTHEEVAEIYNRQGFAKHILKGLTNHTWLVSPREGVLEVLRVPGRGTENFIRRDEEPIVVNLIRDLQITPATAFYPEGLKTTEFLARHRTSKYTDFDGNYFKALCSMLHKLHELPYRADLGFAPAFIIKEMALYEHTAGTATDPATKARLEDWAKDFDSRPQVLCHRDLLPENIMVIDNTPESMRLIDFEYAGFTYYLWDLASFILETGLDEERRRMFATCYGLAETDLEGDLLRMEILVDYIWGLWGLTNNYLEYGENRLSRMRRRLAAFVAA